MTSTLRTIATAPLAARRRKPDAATLATIRAGLAERRHGVTRLTWAGVRALAEAV